MDNHGLTVTGSGRRVLCGLLLAALVSAPAVLQAGIVRNVLASVGLAKPDPPKIDPTTGAPVFPRSGFACCNLHNDGSSINDGNYSKYPLIAAGTPVEVLSYGRNEAAIRINGKPMRLIHDYGHEQESLDAWVNKIIVKVDPTPRINAYPAAVQTAIRAGRVTIGMTREQAIVAVGYPLTSENPSLDEPVWRVWRSSHGEYDLHFENNGRIGSVTGEPDVLSQVLYQPGR